MRIAPPNRMRTLGIALLFVGGAAVAAADGGSTDLDRIAAAQGSIRTLRARFVQRRSLELFAEELVSRGRFYFKRPDRFRWDVDEPIRVSMMVADGRILTKDGDAPQAHAVPLPVSAQEIAGLLTGSVEILRGLFDVQRSAPTTAGERLELRPLQPALARTVQAVTLDLAPRENYVQRIVLHEPSGDRTEITFEDVEVNGSLSDGLFTFETGEVGR